MNFTATAMTIVILTVVHTLFQTIKTKTKKQNVLKFSHQETLEFKPRKYIIRNKKIKLMFSEDIKIKSVRKHKLTKIKEHIKM